MGETETSCISLMTTNKINNCLRNGKTKFSMTCRIVIASELFGDGAELAQRMYLRDFCGLDCRFVKGKMQSR